MDDNFKALIQAIENNDVDAVKKAIEDGADVNKEDTNGYQPLTYACSEDYGDIAKVLIENGANKVCQCGKVL